MSRAGRGVLSQLFCGFRRAHPRASRRLCAKLRTRLAQICASSPLCTRPRGGAAPIHKIYRVISDEDAAHDGDLRVIDESGEDYLYSADRFIPNDVPKSEERAILKASCHEIT